MAHSLGPLTIGSFTYSPAFLTEICEQVLLAWNLIKSNFVDVSLIMPPVSPCSALATAMEHKEDVIFRLYVELGWILTLIDSKNDHSVVL
jgi:hypothetical protein